MAAATNLIQRGFKRRQFLSTGAALSSSVLASGALLGGSISNAAFAQSADLIRLVIPFSAGATSDVLARPIMDALAKELGQPIVIDNKPGAGGTLGAAEVARATPNGLTLAWGTVSNHAIAPSLYAKPGYDPLKDFTPIALLLSVPHVIMVHPSVPAKNLAELVAVLKANPGKYDYASSGNGTISHLIAEAFKAQTGAYSVHIPYRSSAQGLPDFLAGRVPLMFDTVVASKAAILDGRAKAIAVTSSTRSHVLPDVPTIKESGLPALANFEATGWFGLYAPPALPQPVLARLNTAVNKVIALPDVAQRLRSAGATVIGGSPDAFAQFNRQEVARWAELIKKLGVKAD